MIGSRTTGLVTALVSAICVSSSHAQVTVSIGGQAESGANYVNFDTLTSGQTTSFTSGALTLNFTGDAAEDGPGSTAPYLSGNNNVNFGPAATGPDSTPYVATGTAGQGTLVFDFSSPQNYFGLLWGSVDTGPAGVAVSPGNVLTFYSGPDGTGSVVQTVTGAGLLAADPSLNNGDIGIDGTAYVNINTGSGFESAVAETGITSFEIDNVAYGTAGTVPDGGMTLGLLGGSMLGLQALRRKLAR